MYVKIVPAPIPEPSVVLELSWAEAKALMGIVGQASISRFPPALSFYDLLSQYIK